MWNLSCSPKLHLNPDQVSGDGKPRLGEGKGQPCQGTGSGRSQRKAICVTTTYQEATVSAILRHFRKSALKELAASGCPDRNSARGRRQRKEHRPGHAPTPPALRPRDPRSQRTPLPGARPGRGTAREAPGRRQNRPDKLRQTRTRAAAERVGAESRSAARAAPAACPSPRRVAPTKGGPGTKAASGRPTAAPTPRPPLPCWR